MANHEDRHGTEGDPEPAHKSEQVAAIKLVRVHDGEDDGSNRENDADHQRALIDPLYDRRSRQIELVGGHRAHFSTLFCPSDFSSGMKTGSVAPEPGSANFGGCDGTFCPAGTSFMLAL